MNTRSLVVALLICSGYLPSPIRAADVVYVFSHLAGSPGGLGSTNGMGAAARFVSPAGLITNSAGDLFVADYGDMTIRKVTPGGVVTTFAGAAGQMGYTDGFGAEVRFDLPSGIAVDGADNLYVTDQANNTLRKITPNGVVTTLAGMAGAWGTTDGTGSQARFQSPTGVTVDGAGNIYVVDSNNNSIRKVTPAGAVTTLAGGGYPKSGSADGMGYSAKFTNPRAAAVDKAGNVYVVDQANGTIRKVTPAGLVTTFAGQAGWAGSTDGVGAAARFGVPDPYGSVHGPAGITIDDAGNLYVGDTWNDTIRKITPDAVVTTFAGTAGQAGSEDGTGAAARFSGPSSLAIDQAGSLFVSDSLNRTIRRISPDGVVSTLAGSAPRPPGSTDGNGADASFGSPDGVAVNGSGELYVADSANHTIRKIEPNGDVTTLAGTAGQSGGADGTGPAARFAGPSGVATDAAGNIYVADTYNDTIRMITPSGIVTTLAGRVQQPGSSDGPGTTAQFHEPSDVAVDRHGNVYVADTMNSTIRLISPSGAVTTFAGAALQAGAADGKGAAARFAQPFGLTVDREDNVYVADGNAAIRKITPDGVVTTLAGLAGRVGYVDGPGAVARFGTLSHLAVDPAGNLYVSDSSLAGGSDTIRKITPAGFVSTWAGGADRYGSADGTADVARFNRPRGIAIDQTGKFYIADTDNHAIRVGIPALTGPRLVNISCRALGGTGNKVAIGGFVIAGNGTKRLLLRAVGSSLTAQGISPSEVMANPTIEVHDARHNNAVLATIDNWTDTTNPAATTELATQLGATSLADTKSSAVILTLPPGIYSFVTRDQASGSGIVLVEVYDADTTATTSTFANISARVYCTTGNGVSIGGFVVNGNAAKRVLLRAVGPTLATQGLGVNEVLEDPTIEVHDTLHDNRVIAVNDNWPDDTAAADVISTAARLGATPLAASDATSSALLITLAPGVYSFVARGKANTSGIVLVEVYDADEAAVQ